MKNGAITLLIVIVGVSVVALLLLQGCAQKHEVKSYVSVEKPPIKLTYIDYSRDVTPNDVDKYIHSISKVPYKNIKLNENNIVDIHYSVSTESEHISTVNLNKGE